MKLKQILLIFLIGIVIGLGLSPLTDKNPKEVILSPIILTLAKTKKLILPTSEENVLGSSQNNQSNQQTNDQLTNNQTSQFGDLIATPSSETNNQENILTPSLYNKTIKIAIIGDSIVNNMETDLPYLHASLQSYYPKAKLELFNYGINSQNIEQALTRLDKEYNHNNRSYPTLKSLNPNIIIISSFSYSPFNQGEDEIYRHWAGLAKLVEWVKKNTKAKPIILAEISPNKEKFGQGEKGINWQPDKAHDYATLIQEYLENTISFAKGNYLPLANAYQSSLNSNKEGKLSYINKENYIHQSEVGNSLMAKMLAEEIAKLGAFK